MADKLKNWIKGHRSLRKIDYMSLNRLRQNQSVTSTIPVRLSYTERTRRADNLIWVHSHDTSITFDNMGLTYNPYGMTPLTALAIFHTDMPCRLSYTVHSEIGSEDYHFDYDELTVSHVAPIFGLYADTINYITLTLYREDGSELATRIIEQKTDALPDDNSYPAITDKAGNMRYMLTISAQDRNLYPLASHRFIVVNDHLRTRTGNEPLPTHVHEIDLLGRTYQTTYIGSGIQKIYEPADEQGNLLAVIPTMDGSNSILIAVDRNIGSIVHVSKDFDIDSCHCPVQLENKYLDDISWDSQTRFVASGESLEQIEYPETGWLRPPVLYKAASVESSGAMSLADIKETYGLSFLIIGNNLAIETGNDNIQEIVFSRADQLYALDLTNPPLSDEKYENYRYTLAVPFTEMHSGTYTVVIRFRNGEQTVLQDTVSLSRERTT